AYLLPFELTFWPAARQSRTRAAVRLIASHNSDGEGSGCTTLADRQRHAQAGRRLEGHFHVDLVYAHKSRCEARILNGHIHTAEGHDRNDRRNRQRTCRSGEPFFHFRGDLAESGRVDHEL